MKHKYAIQILQAEAYKLGGEILTNLVLLEGETDTEALAREILFGSFSRVSGKATVEKFDSLIRAIGILQNGEEGK